MVRKPEKGTGPKIFYLGADESVDPAGNRRAAVHVSARARCICGRSARPSRIRRSPAIRAWTTTCRTRRPGASTWCCTCWPRASRPARCSSRRCFWLLGDRSPLVGFAGPFLSAVFAAATAVVLVIDLERPERFYYILTRPNWTSWMARGAFLLTAHWLARRPVGRSSDCSDGRRRITVTRAGRDDRAPSRRRRTRACSSRRASRAISGRARTRRSISSRRRSSKAAPRCCSWPASPAPTRRLLSTLGWTMAWASLVHLTILAFEHLRHAKRDAASRAGGARDPLRRVEGAVLVRRDRLRRHRPAAARRLAPAPSASR